MQSKLGVGVFPVDDSKHLKHCLLYTSDAADE